MLGVLFYKISGIIYKNTKEMEMIFVANTKDEVNVEKLYGQECILPKEEFIKKYNVNESGLESSQANERLEKYGKNELKQSKSKKWYN